MENFHDENAMAGSECEIVECSQESINKEYTTLLLNLICLLPPQAQL